MRASQRLDHGLRGTINAIHQGAGNAVKNHYRQSGHYLLAVDDIKQIGVFVFAIRAALGAGTARLVRQSIVETMKLCAVSGALGIAIAPAFLRLLKSFAPPGTPRIDEVGIDTRVFLFAAGLSLILGLSLGLASARLSASALATSTRSATGTREHRILKNVLVAAEFACAMALLTGAVLLFRSFAAVQAVHPGVQADHVLTVEIELPDS